MSRFVLKLEDNKYVIWSTVTDSPTTLIFSREGMLEYLNISNVTNDNAEDLNRTDIYGTSLKDGTSADEIIKYNRAGNKEETLSKEELIKLYSLPYFKP